MSRLKQRLNKMTEKGFDDFCEAVKIRLEQMDEKQKKHFFSRIKVME